MDKAGVDISVLLPVATKPTQPKGINSWARSFAEKEPRIIPFGAVFPDETAEAQLEELAERGYKGIKLHGDFQGFYADDEKMLPIYRRCAEYGLICVMHAGLDCVSPHDIHVTPERMARVLDKVSGVKFVLAHMGGNCIEDRAAKILAGADDVWVDTAYAAGRISPEKWRSLWANTVLTGCFLPPTARGTILPMTLPLSAARPYPKVTGRKFFIKMHRLFWGCNNLLSKVTNLRLYE